MCGIYLNRLGKDVTLVEMQDDWAKDAYFMHKNAMIVEVRESNIDNGTKAKAVTEEGSTADGEVPFEADTILVAAGMKAERSVAESYYTAPRVFEAETVSNQVV